MAKSDREERDFHEELIEYNNDRKSRRRDRRKKKNKKSRSKNTVDRDWEDDDLDYEKFMGLR